MGAFSCYIVKNKNSEKFKQDNKFKDSNHLNDFSEILFIGVFNLKSYLKNPDNPCEKFPKKIQFNPQNYTIIKMNLI